jgi:hypothetical protein
MKPGDIRYEYLPARNEFRAVLRTSWGGMSFDDRNMVALLKRVNHIRDRDRRRNARESVPA